MDEDDKRIIIAMYIGGTGAQLVESLCTQLKPQIEMRELQERLEILAETFATEFSSTFQLGMTLRIYQKHLSLVCKFIFPQKVD